MPDEPVCDECGFSVYSEEHMRGVGLHGHQRTSEEEADEQRADVMRRAEEFARQARIEELQRLQAEAAEGLAELGVAGETGPPRPKTLSAMTKLELLALAAERGVPADDGMTTAQLREALGMRKRS